ncbi:Cleavage polyadenylation factor subunit clp1, partial [Ascosphaera aggregata]
MSVLPGLGLTEPTAEAQDTSAAPVTLKIEPGSEWRFEINFLATIRVQLVRGTAELFGTELALGQTYTFSAMKGAIYTWHGCELAISQGEPIASLATGLSSASTTATGPGPGLGGCQVEYIAEETPMMEYANVHFGLETIREKARQAGKEGPRVLILGPNDAGKTSLTKVLTAYATKRGRQPIVVNLDPSEGMLSVPPGGLTATALRTMIDIEEGW